MSSLFFPLFLVLLGILLLVVFLIVEPADIRRQAKRDFQTFVQLMQPADVALYADEAQTKTPYSDPTGSVCADAVRGDAVAGRIDPGQRTAADSSPNVVFRQGRRTKPWNFCGRPLSAGAG